MQSIVLKRSLVAGAVLFAVAVIALATANAQPTRAQESPQAEEQIEPANERGSEMRTQGQGRREMGQARLEAGKLKACERRQKTIQNIMARMSDRGTKQFDVFTKISDRTQEFYAEKGKVLENYDALISELNAKKFAVEAVLSETQAESNDFACDGENPKGVASAFKDKLHAQNAALKEYRTAIKNLIVGVKSVQSTAATDRSTEEGSQE